MSSTSELPVAVQQRIDAFVASAKTAFESDLVAVVIYGSAAEGRLRATSDVNLLLVLKDFGQAQADRLREPLRLAHAAVQLNAMFLLESEVPAAMEAFAIKFADIVARHRMLFGPDPFENLDLPRDALIRRLKQVLLNLQLRLRERYVLLSLREEQLALVIADAAGPLRSSAASLLRLEGQHPSAPKEALEQVVREMNDASLGAALQEVSAAREERQLSPGRSSPVLISLIEITRRLRERAGRLPQAAETT
jgi:predicted nucleotidyltransferase